MEFYDVSEWLCDLSLSSRGTRDKGIVYHPEDNTQYFLKFPLQKQGRDYWTETWSEIIASEIGQWLKFNVLQYHFAIRNGRQGCLSKTMRDDTKGETLIEGEEILSRYDLSYNPYTKDSYSKYTLDFVVKALNHKNAGNCIKPFLYTLVFDSIIGNSDRHQGNWGILESRENSKQPSFLLRHRKRKAQLISQRFAPIYDSGCCLGREYSEEEIQKRLENRQMFQAYINKGFAELRLNDNPKKKTPPLQLVARHNKTISRIRGYYQSSHSTSEGAL